MVEKDRVIKEKVKHSGLGNFKDLYKFAREWLENEGFSLTEEEYGEKLAGNAKDIEFKWTAARKMTDYFKMVLNLKWRIIAMTDVEVEVDGKKINMNKFGEIYIEIAGTLEKDYSSKWEGTSMQKFFKEIYHKYVIPARTEQKEDQVKGVVQQFKEEMKAFLELTGRK